MLARLIGGKIPGAEKARLTGNYNAKTFGTKDDVLSGRAVMTKSYMTADDYDGDGRLEYNRPHLQQRVRRARALGVEPYGYLKYPGEQGYNEVIGIKRRKGLQVAHRRRLEYEGIANAARSRAARGTRMARPSGRGRTRAMRPSTRGGGFFQDVGNFLGRIITGRGAREIRPRTRDGGLLRALAPTLATTLAPKVINAFRGKGLNSSAYGGLINLPGSGLVRLP